ncbi:hypothetical protein Aph01nite_73800 [Acrocarpospora phusangensis]|uniref:Uncharacterized protein n=1 Tax=Acrocarpospora phusangensis TaxID=1070424 RepID=A0A919QKD9_9ACTN|nr:hypothetical protein [Acrocarpospora phusangensis]GIH29070.1 hypothetical protein Aph01nite_73800 [Acrocarpospora phusangensis]
MSAHVTTGAPLTLTGTFVLSFGVLDIWHSAVQHVSNAAIGLLQKYLTRPPLPGVLREDMAAAYGLTMHALRRDNRILTAAGLLLQARRQVGKGLWQHLIVAVSEPARMVATHEAWALLDASLAASRATERDASPAAERLAPSEDAGSSQVTTYAAKRDIEPVNNSPARITGHSPATVLSTVGELRDLAKLPPLPAPRDQGDVWLTPGQVLSLMVHYPPRYGDLALGLLARAGLPWYLAPRIMALMIAGYSTDQLARTLASVHDGEHPASIARWRLDQLLLAPEPDHAPWVAPSTVIREAGPADPDHRARVAAAARTTMLRAKGKPYEPAPRSSLGSH